MRTEYDADDIDWNRLDEEQREEIRAWMRDEGIDPRTVTRLRLVNEGAVEVDRYLIDDEGTMKVVADDGSPLPDSPFDWPDEVRPAKETVTVPVSTPPPPAWWS